MSPADALHTTIHTAQAKGRALRNGKKYAEFINEAIIVGTFAVRDMITRHASGPQDDSDAESDEEDEGEDDSDALPPTSVQPCTDAVPPSPARPRTGPRSPPLLSLLRQRWQPSPSLPLPQPVPVLTRKEKKKTTHRKARALKRETIHAIPGCHPKAIALKRTQQSTPIPVGCHFPSHPGVTSTGWMGTREREGEFEPEA
ncbi:hypothetical protein DFH08DRAFT_976504 [Mycena albidolilacea]|uniref:Uncharacterized protein n=1 Tax=Mycena albidolilacea TaxID=1033008 RepID=A0AAD6Z3R4_9AGAR|nr:hypothetical protein DFH08DRAFT_976504 [Mycena albidolilacea]